MKHLIFAYGSMKRGQLNVLPNAKFIGEGTTVDMFKMVNLTRRPGLVDEPVSKIHGELFEVDDAALAEADKIEGHPRYYRRRAVAVRVEGHLRLAQMYVLHDSRLGRDHGGLPVVAGGRWPVKPA